MGPLVSLLLRLFSRSLLDPFRRDVQAWELMLVSSQLRQAHWTLPSASLRDPAWIVAQRCLSVVRVVMLALDARLRRES